MLINKKDKSFISRSDYPDTNWLNDDNYFVVEDGSELYNKILKYADNGGFELVVEDDVLVDIKPNIEETNQDEVNFDFDYRLTCVELGI